MGSCKLSSRHSEVNLALKHQCESIGLCDSVLRLGLTGTRKMVHGCFLAAASPLLKKTYKRWRQVAMKSQMFVVDLAIPENCNLKPYEQAFQCLIDFCYGDEMTVSEAVAKPLLQLAKAVQMEPLVTVCRTLLADADRGATNSMSGVQPQEDAGTKTRAQQVNTIRETSSLNNVTSVSTDDVRPGPSSPPEDGDDTADPDDVIDIDSDVESGGLVAPQASRVEGRAEEQGVRRAVRSRATREQLLRQQQARSVEIFQHFLNSNLDKIESDRTRSPMLPMPYRFQGLQKRFYCPICPNKTTKANINMSLHYLYHHTRHKVECDVCCKEYRTYTVLQMHKRREHPKSGRAKEYLCTYCGYKTLYRSQLNLHVKQEHTKQLHACPEPGCAFKHASSHEVSVHHRRKHSDERPFLCNECGAGFKFRHALAKHVRSHDKPIACDHCEFRTIGKWELSTHMKKRHPEVAAQEAATSQAEGASAHGDVGVTLRSDVAVTSQTQYNAQQVQYWS